MDYPLISCVTVTQPGRLKLLRRAVDCFNFQSWPNKELIIVHDGLSQEHQSIVALGNSSIRVERVDTGSKLGRLRNLSLKLAKGTFICQWDDDDLYHPDRLMRQYKAIDRTSSASFLVSQYYVFLQEKKLFIRRTNGPIHGTPMVRANLQIWYPEEKAQAEDSVYFAKLREQYRVASLDEPEMYLRVYHGSNTWSYEHHRTRLATEGYDTEQILARRDRITSMMRLFGLRGFEVWSGTSKCFVV